MPDPAPERIWLSSTYKAHLEPPDPVIGATEYVRADRATDPETRHQALLSDAAAKDAEIERLREALERLADIAEDAAVHHNINRMDGATAIARAALGGGG